FESAHHPMDSDLAVALDACESHSGAPSRPTGRKPADTSGIRPTGGEGRQNGDESAAESWRGAFLLAPYLRDTFVACGVLSETFETAITWDRLEEFHATVMETTRRAVAAASG